MSPAEIRARPLSEFDELAQTVVDSQPVISVYASCEFDELSEDGKVWIAAIVREALAIAAEQRQ